MTVATETSKNQYGCDGIEDTFPYTFKIFDSGDLVVVHTDASGDDTTWTEGTQYTVTNVGEDTGGNVVAKAGYIPSGGTTITIYRELDVLQGVDYVEGDIFPAETNEEALDRLTFIDQQQDRQIELSLRAPESDSSGISLELPTAANRANKFLVFDSSGNVTVVGSTETISGTTNHSELNELDYASAGHTGFQPSGNYVTDSEMTTISGDIMNNVSDNYVDNTEMTTISGDIVNQITASSGSGFWEDHTTYITPTTTTGVEVYDTGKVRLGKAPIADGVYSSANKGGTFEVGVADDTDTPAAWIQKVVSSTTSGGSAVGGMMVSTMHNNTATRISVSSLVGEIYSIANPAAGSICDSIGVHGRAVKASSDSENNAYGVWAYSDRRSGSTVGHNTGIEIDLRNMAVNHTFRDYYNWTGDPLDIGLWMGIVDGTTYPCDAAIGILGNSDGVAAHGFWNGIMFQPASIVNTGVGINMAGLAVQKGIKFDTYPTNYTSTSNPGAHIMGESALFITSKDTLTLTGDSSIQLRVSHNVWNSGVVVDSAGKLNAYHGLGVTGTAYFNDYITGPLAYGAPKIRTRGSTGHAVSFDWDGTHLYVYIDNTLVVTV